MGEGGGRKKGGGKEKKIPSGLAELHFFLSGKRNLENLSQQHNLLLLK